MNGSNTAGRPGGRHRHQPRQHGGTLNRSTMNPPLPLNPMPRQPPSNFLCRSAVAAEHCTGARNIQCGVAPAANNHSSRCSLICCPDDEDHHLLKSSTAGDNKYYCTNNAHNKRRRMESRYFFGILQHHIYFCRNFNYTFDQ